MDAQYLLVDQRSEPEAIKALHTMSPDGCIPVFAEALVVETVDLRNLTTLFGKLLALR